MIELTEEMAIALSISRNKIALIDREDLSKVNILRWYCNNFGYAVSTKYIKGSGRKNQKSESILMHRVILGVPKNIFIDHINHNRLDNRKSNLRIATYQQNQWNKSKILSSSKYKGVSYFKRDDCWRARIKLNYKEHHIGFFKNELHAAMAYDIWAKELFGEFANLNFKQI